MQTLIALLLAFAGYSVMNISQAGQKIGLEKKVDRPAVGWLLWTGATVGTLLGVFVVLAALSMGAVSLVGAMAGSGLVTLAIFSHFVMGETIEWRDIAAIATIVAGSVLIGFFAAEQSDSTPRWILLHGFVVVLVVAYALGWIAGGRGERAGIILGGFGGALAGASMLYQNAATIVADVGGLVYFPLSESLAPARLAGLINPYLFLWFGLSMGAFFVLQIAYGRGKAIHVIPAFNVNFIAVPVIGGVVGFSEAVRPMQWVGIGIIVAGTVLLTATPSAQPVEIDQ
ncbi:MAG TPA: hypothetical protein VKA06_03070 [Spirochaetia bacterium]|nr:hypothetical protein [Spirochaetia bacterium]